MELQHLRIQAFRNLRDVDITPGTRFNIFSGPNGQGKTNLLEAIYLLSAAKSFRGSRNADMISWDDERALVEGQIDRAGHQRHASIRIASTGKRVELNGQFIRSMSDYFGTLGAVVFAPDDLMILKGSPSDRRRFIDRAVFSARAAYLAEVQDYEKVLKQRNAHLKNPKGGTPLLEVFNEQISHLGALVARRRLQYLLEFQPFYKRAFSSIFFGDDPSPTETRTHSDLFWSSPWLQDDPIHIHPDFEVPSLESLQERLLGALQRTQRDDLHRGFTTRGPHRDDLTVHLLERDARNFASQGQTRSIVLALKIAQIQVVRELYHHAPILLLDDVSSELDRTRNERLFEVLRAHPGQVFITTTHRDHIQLHEDVSCFQILHGNVSPQIDEQPQENLS